MTSWTSPPCMPQPGGYAELVSQPFPNAFRALHSQGMGDAMWLYWLKAQPNHDRLRRFSCRHQLAGTVL